MYDWLEQLRRWIKRLFRGKKPKRSHPTILKRWYGAYCAVLRLERNTPGAVGTYRIIPKSGTPDYLLTLDYLPELQAELVGKFNGTAFRLRPLNHPHNHALTHRFAVWEVYPNSNTFPIGIWDVDLEGYAASTLAMLAPKRAICGVALRPLQIIDSTKTIDMSWASQMTRVNWLGLLEEKIRGELSNANHNLKAYAIQEN